MNLTVNEIAGLIHAEVFGDRSFPIKGVSSFDDASPHHITFASDTKFLTKLSQTHAGAVIVPLSYTVADTISRPVNLLKVENPKVAFFKIVSLFHPEKEIHPGIHPSANVGHRVTIGKNTVIGPNVVIGDNVLIGDNVQVMPGVYIGDEVILGDNTIIKPNVTVIEKSRIGKNVIIHSGTVIGSDGFGFTPISNTHEKIIHTGYVNIGNNVEIGACNTIDRGTLGMTILENGVKTDNLVHIAHNVKIRENTLVVAQVGIAGSTTVGRNVIIAGKAGIAGHINIGDGAIIGPYSGVHSDVPANEIVSGIPQMPHHRWRKVVAVIARLPEMRKNLFNFEKRLKRLENKNE
jgi:UDP-3-O-[3-hydroxymyristoyl] glucosamine N-acyltransferase